MPATCPGRRAFAFSGAAMSGVTLESLDYALAATRHQWLTALESGQFRRVEKIQARLDDLLDQRCAVITVK